MIIFRIIFLNFLDRSWGSGHPQTRRGKQHMPKPWRDVRGKLHCPRIKLGLDHVAARYLKGVKKNMSYLGETQTNQT